MAQKNVTLSPTSTRYSPELIKKVFASCDLLPNTRIQYCYKVNLFLRFAGNSLTRQTLLDFKEYLRDQVDSKEFSTSSANNYLAAAKTFLKALHSVGKIPDVYSHVKLFKIPTGHKRKGFTTGEVKKIVKYIASLSAGLEEKRMKALFALMYFQGFRSDTCRNIRVEDIDFSGGTARVTLKGMDGKSEEKPLHPHVISALRRYIDALEIEGGYIFISLSNNSYGEQLSKKGIYNMFVSAMKAAGVRGNKVGRRFKRTPHGMRHHAATRVAEILGGDISGMMDFFDWKSAQTPGVYIDEINKEKNAQKIFEGMSRL